MSRIFYITAAAAMFASVAAFAQTPDKPAAAPDTSASAPAASDSAAPGEGKMHHHHHHHHGMRSAGNGNTDFDADKLNACMSNATPTDQQEMCLKHATSS
jgi:G3E family GTPase